MTRVKTAACLGACLLSAQSALLSGQSSAPHYFLTTVAGNNPSVTAPVALNQPEVASLVAYDSHGTLYYGDSGRIWRLNSDGSDTLIAGSGAATFTEGGAAVDAPIGDVEDFKFDSQGNLYIADGFGNKVYKVTPAGVITTFAGNGQSSSDLTSLPATGPNVPAASVPVSPVALATDSSDHVYVQIVTGGLKSLPFCSAFLSFPPDGSSSAVVATAVPCQDTFLENQSVTTVLGLTEMTIANQELFVTLSGTSYEISLPGSPAQQPTPFPSNLGYNFSAGPDGSIHIFTSSGLAEVNPKTSTIDPLPNSSAVTGGESLAVNPVTGDVAVATGSETSRGTVSVFTASTGTYQPVACNAPVYGGDGGPAALAILNDPRGLASDAEGNLYIADTGNSRIRKIAPDNIINTIAGTGSSGDTGDGASALAAEVNPYNMAIDGAGNLYFISTATSTNDSIRKIDTKGNISTVAGGGAGKLANGAAATSVSINATYVAADSAGDIYFGSDFQVWEANTSGTISLVAGTGSQTAIVPGTPAASAGLGAITALAVDKSGNVYFGDGQHQTIWKVDSQGNIDLVAGENELTPKAGVPPLTAGPATGMNIGAVNYMVVDSQGNIYFAGGTTLSPQVAVIDTSGNLTPIGGGGNPPTGVTGTFISSGDGGDAALGTFADIRGMAMDRSGNIYVSDVLDGNFIREMSPYNPASPPPFISQGGVVGAGGSLPAVQAVSPGGEVSIFGENFVSAANQHTLGPGDLVGGKVPTTLAGVCASFGGSPAAMLGVYPNQLNVQAGALTPGAVTVQVTTNCGTPQAVTSNYAGVVVQTASPEFYSFAPDPIGGHNPIAAVNALTGAFIGPPGLLQGVTFVAANAGDIVQAYGTGWGATTPSYGLGVIPGAAGTLNAPYSLTLGGMPIPAANVEYAGISPCCAGFYQIDFTVPQGTPSGALPLVITIGGVASPPQAFIQVQ